MPTITNDAQTMPTWQQAFLAADSSGNMEPPQPPISNSTATCDPDDDDSAKKLIDSLNTQAQSPGDTSQPISSANDDPISQATFTEIALSIVTTVISGITFGSAVILQILKYNSVLPAMLVTATNLLTVIAIGFALFLAAVYFINRPQSTPDQQNIGMTA
jgi:hypothetical protein